MKFGFDAKRAFHNNTGLGNYSRDCLRLLAKYFPENQYHLYNTKPGKIDFSLDSPNVSIHFPKGRINKLAPPIWRQFDMLNQAIDDGVDIFVGLSNELPIGSNKKTIKTIVVIHDLIFIRFPKLYSKIDQRIHVAKVKRSCNHADKIIAISQSTKNDIVEFLGVDENKIEVVYQGCNKVFQQEANLDLQSAVRNKYKLPERFILNVGTIEERKGLLTVVQAIADLKEIHLVVLGRETEYAKKIRDFVEREKMEDRVHFLKNIPQNELAAIYQAAEIFVYPSIFEGFGIPIIEALFSKTPVITSTGSCFSEAGGEFSWYIEPGNSSELKLALVEMWNSEETRTEIAKRSFEFVQKFKDESIAKNLMKAISI